MTRQDIDSEIIRIFQDDFEIEHPGVDDHLREKHNFDSIDAIELLVAIERFLGSELMQAEKKQAMEIRTIRQIGDYVESLAKKRQIFAEG
jgi:acyl carrier protein